MATVIGGYALPKQRKRPRKGSVEAGTRMRKVECPECGYTFRVSRKWIMVGLPTCPCGAGMVCPDITDAILLPGEEGEEIGRIAAALDAEFAERSERSKKGNLKRHRCKADGCGSYAAKDERYCSLHRDQDLPF